ncbi:MAG: DUF4157 domain-containing protein, partial [Myxococcota bacterium]
MKPTTQSTLDAPYNASPNAPQVEPNRVGGHRSVEEVAQLRVASGVTGQEIMAFREGMVQRRGRSGAPSDPKEVTSIAAQGLSGTSQALPYRERLESGFGVDLSGVRVHTDAAAVQASRAIGAQAYTMGNNIALAQPNPSQELMAHEVAHVIQQRAGSGPASGVGQVGAAPRGDLCRSYVRLLLKPVSHLTHPAGRARARPLLDDMGDLMGH